MSLRTPRLPSFSKVAAAAVAAALAAASSSSSFVASAQQLCGCTNYDQGATPGQATYCALTFGTAVFCIPGSSSAACGSYFGTPTNLCLGFSNSPTTSSPTTPPPTAPQTSASCGCTSYQNGAVAGQGSYCLAVFGTAKFCFPNTGSCAPQFGVQTTACSDPTSSPTLPPVAPTTPPATSCACAIYGSGAQAGSSSYCYQMLGTTQFCYPSSSPCLPQNGLPTSTCSVATASPTPALTTPTCTCAYFLGGAVQNPSSGYCSQTFGTATLCYPLTSPCVPQNGQATSACSPIVPATASPTTVSPTTTSPTTAAPTVPLTTKMPTPVPTPPTTPSPTNKPGPTVKPTSAKPTTNRPTSKPTGPTPPTVPTIPLPPTPSPTPKPTTKGGMTPIAGIFIALLVIFILFGGYQYVREKRTERQNKVRAEQEHQMQQGGQQQQPPREDFAPVSVI